MFVTLEGINGSGKTTQARALVKKLEEWGYTVVHTREPGGCPSAEHIRNLLLKLGSAISPNTQMLLLFASRIEHIQCTIEPALERNEIVVCERFSDTTYAYQVNGLGASSELFDELEYQLKIEPDLSVFLDVSPNVAEVRMAQVNGDQTDNIQSSITDTSNLWGRIYEGLKERVEEFPDRFWTTPLNADKDTMAVEIHKCAQHIDHVMRERHKKAKQRRGKGYWLKQFFSKRT